MVLKVDTSRRQMKRYKYKAGRGLTLKKVNSKINKLASSVEVKHLEVADTSGGIDYDLTWNGHGIRIAEGISQGDQENARTGTKVTLKRIEMRFDCYPGVTGMPNAFNGYTPRFARFILFIDKQGNTYDPGWTVAELLQVTGSVYSVTSPQNWDTRKQYRILYDKVVRLTNTSDYAHYWKKTINLGNLNVQYDATSGDVRTNELVMVAISADDPTAVTGANVTNQTILRSHMRLTFTDL